MTDPTTKDLLAAVRSYIINEDQIGTSAAFVELERALMRGSPLPSQWPHAKELEEMRGKAGKYEKLLHSFAYGVALDQDDYISDSQEALKP